MGMMEIRRRIIESEPQTISNIPVYKDNACYPNVDSSNPARRGSFNVNSDYFIAGVFDTKTTASKEYTHTVFPQWPGGKSVTIRTYNTMSKTESAISRSAVSYNTGTKTVTLSGRYVMVTVYKPVADNSYMYYTIDGVKHYLFKGKNVTE